MAVIPPIRKLYLEDYASQKAWIGPFLIILNTFMSAVVNALTRNLTLIDNTTSDVKYVTLYSVPSASAPASISWTKTFIPIAVLVGNTRLTNGSFTLSNSVGIQWQMSSSNTSLQITNVVGVTPTQSSPYILTLVCIAG